MCVCILNVSIFIWSVVYNGGFAPFEDNAMFGPTTRTLVDMGAKYGPLVVDGEWWRWLTPVFLHVGLFHIALNTFGLFRLCYQLERKFGTFRIMLVYLVCGIGGNGASLIFIPGTVSCGASSAIFGMLGITVVDLIQNFRNLKVCVDVLACCHISLMCCSQNPWYALITTILSVVFALVLGLLPLLDNFAHIGGFVFGVLCALTLLPRLDHLDADGRQKRIIIMLCAAPVLIGLFLCEFLLFYLLVDPAGWCQGCQYIDCVPIYINGQNWCDGGVF